MNEERHERKRYWLMSDCEAAILVTKGLCPSIPCLDREGGQNFWFFYFYVVKELNNENRWRVPDRIDQVT
jgi:hypothetical protein